jgi:TetR/AcrR family tetracycline transcriptional repressor
MTSTTSTKEGGRERGLERGVVVALALQLLDEVGYSGLTLRRLADRLQVKAAALYWHFENKQDLIDAMAERIMLGEFEGTRPPSSNWRDLLGMVARTHRKALLRYRDGAQIMAHANMRQSSMLEGMEMLLSALETQGFSAKQSMGGFFVVVRYTLGCVFEEQADPRTKAQHVSHIKQFQNMADKYPAIAKTFSETISESKGKGSDYMFELGLKIILDGIALQLQGDGLTPSGGVA